jgi:hypothetical protein
MATLQFFELPGKLRVRRHDSVAGRSRRAASSSCGGPRTKSGRDLNPRPPELQLGSGEIAKTSSCRFSGDFRASVPEFSVAKTAFCRAKQQRNSNESPAKKLPRDQSPPRRGPALGRGPCPSNHTHCVKRRVVDHPQLAESLPAQLRHRPKRQEPECWAKLVHDH